METKQIKMHYRFPGTATAGLSGDRLRLALLCILSVGLLGALASPVLAAEATAPPPQVSILTDQVYGTAGGIELLCDVYRPLDEGDVAPQRPAVLVIHGGAWSAGSRRTMAGYAMRLARAGIVAIAVDYRLAPEHPFPAAVDDTLAALDDLAERGIAVERTALGGDSAGGGLALATLASLVTADRTAPAARAESLSEDPAGSRRGNDRGVQSAAVSVCLLVQSGERLGYRGGGL